jgi:hypothetical protein
LVLAATFSTNTRSSSGVNLAASCLDISRCGDGGGGTVEREPVTWPSQLWRPSHYASHQPQMKAVFAVAACLALATVCGCCLGGVSWASPCRAHSWAPVLSAPPSPPLACTPAHRPMPACCWAATRLSASS